MEVEMKGSVLIKTLEAGQKNTGTGGYLHFSDHISYDPGTKSWQIREMPVEPEKTYKVAMTDFLMTGSEANMEFLKKDNPGITRVYPVITDLSDPRSDIRLAIIRYMEKL